MSTNNPHRPLKNLLAFRLFLVTLLLGALILFEFIWPHESTDSVPVPLYSFIILTYLLNILYLVSLPKIVRIERFIQQQLLVDATLIAGLLYLTGGFYSIFFPLFYFIILGGTIYLERQHTIALLFYCTFLYLLLIFAHIYNPLQNFLPLPELVSSNRKVISQIFFNLTPFYLTAFILRFIAKERIDTRKRLQEATRNLKESKDLNKHIIASIDSGLITTNRELMINSINLAGSTILGLSRDKIFNIDLQKVIPNLQPGKIRQGRRRQEISYQTPDNKHLILGFSFAPLLGSQHNNIGWILIFQDLTELKKIENRLQEARKMAAIGRLSAGIAHEIRNPLASISGSIELLAQDLLFEDETQQRLLQIVLKESTRLNHLISDFLGFSRLEGKEQTDTNIISLLKDMVFLFRSQCPDVNFNEDYHTEKFIIKANPEQLEQIFWNLIQNSLEAMSSQGEITITSSGENGIDTESDKPYKKELPEITITICDNGPGIKEEITEEIFEPFFTTKTSGTGLGLYIAFQLTQINNGIINLENRKDITAGTCAHVCFPRSPQDNQPQP
jgi:two-component system sensor histidine kinase PilS (NtrC family)